MPFVCGPECTYKQNVRALLRNWGKVRVMMLGWAVTMLYIAVLPSFPIILQNYCIKIKRLEKLSQVTTTEKKKEALYFPSVYLYLSTTLLVKAYGSVFFHICIIQNSSTDFTQTSNIFTYGLRSSVENRSQKECELWAMGKGRRRQGSSWISNYIILMASQRASQIQLLSWSDFRWMKTTYFCRWHRKKFSKPQGKVAANMRTPDCVL